MSEFEKKILELLKNIDKKLDKILGEDAPAPKPVSVPKVVIPETIKEEIPETTKEEKAETIEYTSYVKPSEIAAKQVDAEKPKEEEEEPVAEGRRVCPDCGSTEFNQIEDRTKILHQMGGMKIYAKNHQCKKCGFIL